MTAGDTALVERARAGDDAAFELLVRRHTPQVWRLARAMLRDDFAAEEAVQDTFVKAYRALAGFRADAGVATWLHAICHRTCLDALKRRSAVVVPLSAVGEGRVGAADRDHALRMAVERLLPTLPDEQREAFVLVDVLGYSREDAAGLVGVPASTMRSRVGKARARLLEALRGDEMELLG